MRIESLEIHNYKSLQNVKLSKLPGLAYKHLKILQIL
jgi:AAA15 family ATPase/GTPase